MERDLAVHSELADRSAQLRRTDTGELVDAIVAEAAVQTGAGLALVDVDVAVFAGEAGRTRALEVQAVGVEAGATIGTGEAAAEVDAIVTQLARVAGRALALEVADPVPAGSAVQAADTDTVVLVHFAVLAGEALLTAAVVA